MALKEKTADRWITIKSVAATLACTEKHVYTLIQDGALKATKLGKRALRVSEQSLQAFISSRIVNPEDYYAPDDPPPEPRKPKTARMNRG
jgi:excisionase family DNA binding protein